MNLYELQELVEELITLGHGDDVVLLSSDSEGNSFAKLDEGIAFGFYVSKYQEFFNEEDIDAWSEEDNPELKKAIAFYPGW